MNTEEVNKLFIEENDELETLRISSNKQLVLLRSVTFIYVILCFFSIPFGNVYTILLFLGLIPFILIFHQLTGKRMDFEKEMKKIQSKYIKLLVAGQEEPIEYMIEGEVRLIKEALFFNPDLSSFLPFCENQITLNGEKGRMKVLNIDFVHPTNEYRLVDFHWRKSTLIYFENSATMNGRNLLLPRIYVQSSGGDDAGKEFRKVMPLKGLHLYQNDGKRSAFLNYLFFSKSKSEGPQLSADVLNRFNEILKSSFRRKKKFLSFTENGTFMLIYDSVLFAPSIKKSFYKHNIFSGYHKEIAELQNIYRVMYDAR